MDVLYLHTLNYRIVEMSKGTYYRRRVDQNQSEIVDALRCIPGVSVSTTAQLGHGFPDICVGYKGMNYLFEIKATQKDKLTVDEIEWHNKWNGQVSVAYTTNDILQALQIIKELKEQAR